MDMSAFGHLARHNYERTDEMKTKGCGWCRGQMVNTCECVWDCEKAFCRHGLEPEFDVNSVTVPVFK